MNYEEALNYIHSATRFGARSGLHRISELMERLGNPQSELKIIHVAGTNGKGSTCAMTSSVLRQAGYRTGLYISPFVIDFRERMQIDGLMIEAAQLAELVDELMPHCEQMKLNDNSPTEFEIVTACAFLWFARQRCDFVVLEVGLGGRFDATNVIAPPICAAICSISLDHTQYLGDTTGKIAFEKCGVIKSGSPVAIYCDLPQDALDTVKRCCSERGVVPNIANMAQLRVISLTGLGAEFEYKGERYSISMQGEHQVKNALTAIAIFEELAKSGYGIEQRNIAKGLENATFGGRMEVVRQKPLCIIDGAHNLDAVQVLCKNLRGLYPKRRKIVIVGMVKDKDHIACIKEIAGCCDVFVATSPDNPRALSARECAAEAGSEHFYDSPTEAAEAALSLAGDDDMIIACGSLYMIGDAAAVFLKLT